MSVKRCLVVEGGSVVGDYYNLKFAQSQHEVRKLLKALPMMSRLEEPRRFDLLPKNPREEHLYYAFRTPRAAFTLIATLCGGTPPAAAALFAPIRAFLAEEGAQEGNQYAAVTRFLREHFARVEAQSAEEEKIDVLRLNLDAVKEKTQESLRKIVSRGRDLVELGSEAATLSVEAHGFNRSSTALKQTLGRKQRRQRWLLAAVFICALFAVYVIVF